MALQISTQAPTSCLKQTCECDLGILLNTKVGAANDHAESHIKTELPFVRHLLLDRLLRGMPIKVSGHLF